LLTFSLPS